MAANFFASWAGLSVDQQDWLLALASLTYDEPEIFFDLVEGEEGVVVVSMATVHQVRKVGRQSSQERRQRVSLVVLVLVRVLTQGAGAK